MMKKDNNALLNTISTITLLDETTVEIKIKKDQEYELDDAIYATNSIEILGKGEQLFYLTIYGDRTIPTKEARDYCISDAGSRFKLAEAIVVKSLSQKMVFNFMINVERPSVRTKLFTDTHKAKDWLKSLNN